MLTEDEATRSVVAKVVLASADAQTRAPAGGIEAGPGDAETLDMPSMGPLLLWHTLMEAILLLAIQLLAIHLPPIHPRVIHLPAIRGIHPLPIHPLATHPLAIHQPAIHPLAIHLQAIRLPVIHLVAIHLLMCIRKEPQHPLSMHQLGDCRLHNLVSLSLMPLRGRQHPWQAPLSQLAWVMANHRLTKDDLEVPLG